MRGCYSDTDVVGVYTTRELAERAESLAGGGGYLVEFEADMIPKHEPGRRLFEVWMKRTGDAQGSIGLLSAFDSEEGTSVWNYGIGQRGWSFRVWARDAEHAVKIANEKRAMLIAQEPAAS